MEVWGMALVKVRQPLRPFTYEVKDLAPDEVLLRVLACGVCRTDLHIVKGELPLVKVPIIPGHEVVGEVVETGSAVQAFQPGDIVGVPWLGGTCSECWYCRRGKENLCDRPEFTGYTRHGGYATYIVARAQYCFRLPVEQYDPFHLAPLLCAGLIGYRSYRMVPEEAQVIGIYGFGAAAHIIAQVAIQQGKTLFAFVKPQDEEGVRFARSLGVAWAGYSNESPPQQMDAAIIYAPVGSLVVHALEHVRKGGTVVCAGIHMSDIPSFPYRILWGERVVRSVANLTRRDGVEFFEVIRRYPVRTHIRVYRLEEANQALHDLDAGNLTGAAVLKVWAG